MCMRERERFGERAKPIRPVCVCLRNSVSWCVRVFEILLVFDHAYLWLFVFVNMYLCVCVRVSEILCVCRWLFHLQGVKYSYCS